jgi:hypothetical protein
MMCLGGNGAGLSPVLFFRVVSCVAVFLLVHVLLERRDSNENQKDFGGCAVPIAALAGLLFRRTEGPLALGG